MAPRNVRAWTALSLTAAACLIMAWVERFLAPIYPVKSGLKALVFLGCILLYCLIFQDWTPLRVFRIPGWRELKLGAALGLSVFLFLLGGYALLSPWLDLSAIPGRLQAKEGITAALFPAAAAYITFGNSLLEEAFFRGFAFLALAAAGGKRLAWSFSALAFALYHVSIMGGWFHPVLLVLFTAGLGAAGLFFNWLDAGSGTVWPAWLVHVGANLATNTIALRLFGAF